MIKKIEENPTIVKLRNKARQLPKTPGVYQFIDKNDAIIYVGKAKDLRKRVVSYFKSNYSLTNKTAAMLRKIEKINFIVVETEFDALLLENSMIKAHQPRYNILLKDDKTYPWICIKNERFPRVFVTRNVIKDGSHYFGPYASLKVMNTLLELIKKNYQLRNCSLNLSEDNIMKGKYKVCLEYHIGNCKAPCVSKQTEEDYNSTIHEIENILKGNLNIIINKCKEEIKTFAAAYEFEKAHLVKLKLDALNNYQSKSAVVSNKISNIDVYSIISEENFAYVNMLQIVDGSIIQSFTIEFKKMLDEDKTELLQLAISEMMQRFSSNATEIIVPFEVGIEIPNVKINVAKLGEKKKLIELSESNAKYFKYEKEKNRRIVDPEAGVIKFLEQVKNDLHLSALPRHIECIDNSNIQGKFAVSAVVVFKMGKPAKSEYRHFNIKTVKGPDDYKTMEEVIFRRYKRLLAEKKNLPQLIVIDGGKGQLSSAVKSLKKLDLHDKINIISIAKKLETIFIPNDRIPLYIDKKSTTLKLIQQLRDEAHRFGITHHRKQRSKATVKTELTEIDGIGQTIADKLLKEFKSIKRIKLATIDDIEKIVGKAKAKVIFEYFKNK